LLQRRFAGGVTRQFEAHFIDYLPRDVADLKRHGA
jgi:hypothetical protein